MEAQETKKEEKKGQCSSVLHAGHGRVKFCLKREGHTGDHRGVRAQWNKTGRVKITEPLVP